MDRNREARRAAHMAAHPRRRHRSTSLRDSTDEDGGVEGHEQQQGGGGSRLRDRGVVMKKDRERERTSRSKRRRENRVINNNNNFNNHNHNHNNRDEIGDESSEESVNDDEDEEDDDDVDAGNNGGFKMLPPAAAVLGNNNNNNIHSNNSINNNSNMQQHQNHHNHNHQQQQQQIQHRKSFPPSAGKVFRSTAAAAPPLPAWKAAADEMIGVSVPRKARSASTKRSHEWVSGVIGTEQSHRQNSTSPAASPAQPVAPPSPSSSNLSVRKKMKANGVVGGPSSNNNNNKPRPPAAPKTSSAKSSSSNPEELEIEIAEVLYGLMTQSQAPSADKKETTPQSNDIKQSIVSSPTPNSTSSVVAPKRKRPRQVSENPFGVRNSPPASSSVKNETDHQNQNQATNSSYMDHVPENGAAAPFGFTSLPINQVSETTNRTQPLVEEEGKCVGVVLTKEEAVSTSSLVGLNEGNKVSESVIMTAAAAANLKAAVNISEMETKKEEKFEIDLMAPPPQQRTSQGNDADVEFSDCKQTSAMETSKNKEDEKVRKKEETISLAEEQKRLKAATVQETGELSKQAVNQELRIDLEKPNKDVASMVGGSSNRSLHQALKQQLPAKSENHTEKIAQPSSVQMPMSVANWPPIGYVAPLQGVISMDGNAMPSAPVQPIFTHPRPKRCATHCYIARNIHYLQQFMKINTFWPPSSGAAPMFGAKPGNLNLMPSAELHGSIPSAMQDKAQGLHIFPGHATTKDTKSTQATTVPDPAQRKQQILLQQAIPPVTPNNILHGPAFIFPFNQQQAVAASASVRPGSSKLNTSTSGGLGGASVPPSSGTNNPYTFPIPAVGAPPNYRGNPHAQAMPLFNGSFYSSQMIHPSQIPQSSQQVSPSAQAQNHHPTQSQQISQTHQNSSGSTSSSQKHLQAQQRQQQGSGSAVNGSGSGNGGSLHNTYPASHKSRSQQPSQHMNPPRQARHLENEGTGGEDSPSTAESRASRAAPTMNVYGHNYTMPVHSQNFALMNPQAAMSTAAASGNSHDKKQQPHSQQQGVKKAGAESSSLPPQTFAMSFSPMNGTTGTMSSMSQNHANAIFQNVPESFRQSYHSILGMAPSMAHSMQKKDFRVPEEASRPAGHHESPSVVDEDRKGSSGLTGKSGQSIAFSRPDIATDASGSSQGMPGTSVIDSSSRNINLGSNNRTSRSPMPTSAANAQAQASHHLHAQFQQQQVSQQAQQEFLQLQKMQQQGGQNINARLKNPPSSNGSAYPDHLITSSSSVIAKFPNSLSSFPLQTSNTSSSPVQSPQWRNSVRGPASSQAPSSLASATTSVKNHHQSHQPHQSHQSQQQSSSRPHQQSHTQISFGVTGQKLQSTTSSQQQQQNQNQNPGTNSSNQSPSPPMLVGSPTTSNISKGGGAGGSPRTSAPASTSGRPAQASSLSSSQQVKNPSVGTTQRSSPSILGNPHNTISTKSQQQQQQQHQKQTMQQQQQQYQAQAHMFMSHPYMQQSQPPQSQQHSGGSNTASGYYLQQRKQQSSQQQTHQTTSTSMLSLSPPVTLANTTTSDPAKAIAAATSNLKGGVGLPQQWAAAAVAAQAAVAAFPTYAHNAPVPVQVKPVEQKQPAGNDNLRTGQPEKK
uniref:protein TIME FOR COFFEE isoform X2 n=1 Tax=Erigeron canadensis TaxID=72917 RepID=UPI001CB8D8C7|nr:protein TIME FOR COFFEE isoform X2 [Erigeron canadensis]